MDKRTDIQEATTEIDLGYRSTDYITTAQKHMDSGNIQECLRVLKSGVQIGAEPKQLLITAHNNALSGMKKLLTIPSAKKNNIKPKQNIFSGERKSVTIHNESSMIKSLRRFKNIGAPIRPVKRTPQKSQTKKISLKKLEESPLLMRYLDAPSPLPPQRSFDQIKWNQSPFSAEDESRKQLYSSVCGIGRAGRNQGSSSSKGPPSEQLKENGNLPLTEQGPLHKEQLVGQLNFFCGKENEFPPLSMTEPAVRGNMGNMPYPYVCKNSSKTMQPCSNHKRYLTGSSTERKLSINQTERCGKLGFKTASGVSSYEVIPSARPSEEQGETTESPGGFSCSGSLSDCWSGTFNTDQNFLSEKERCSSDSGCLEVVSCNVAETNTELSPSMKAVRNGKNPKLQTPQLSFQFSGTSGGMDIDSGIAICSLRYDDNVQDQNSETCAPKVGRLTPRGEKEGVNQDAMWESTHEDLKVCPVLTSSIQDRMFKSSQTVANCVPEQVSDPALEEVKEPGMPLQKFNLSGIAELSNLSISDDKKISSTSSGTLFSTSSSTSSGTLFSTSSTSALSVMSKSTATLTPRANFRQDEAPANTIKAGNQPFRVPAAPAPRLNQPDCTNGIARNGQQSSHSEYFNTRAADASQRESNISGYLVKKRQDAKAARAKSQSTTKKYKMIRIKKEKYKVVSVLGKGGSSKVYEVENDDGKLLAMKCVPLEDLDDFVVESHCNEIEILWALRNSPYIIKLYEFELKNDKLFMLMEKGEMDLEKHLHLNRKMEYDKIRHLWIQMLCAVNSIHKQGIIHTDLKPANFLFVDSSLKLIDFGIAKGLQENCTSTQRDCLIGTLNYMAPESVTESTYYKIRRATDIWSLGCILYLMVYGKTPFQHIQRKALKVAAITDGSQIPFPDIENKDLLDTIKGCLKKNPSQRYTIDELLAHPFVSKGGSPALAQESEDCKTLKKPDYHSFLQQVKESSTNSPNFLHAAQKTVARRRLLEQNNVCDIRKEIC